MAAERRRIVQWANRYKDVVNATEHRNVLYDREGVADISLDEWYTVHPTNAERGTIYQHRDNGEAHFMAWFPDGQGNVVWYDPSGYTPGSAYAAPVDEQERIMQWLSDCTGRNVVRFHDNGNNVQDTDGDTWCQTWTIIILNPTLQDLITGPNGVNVHGALARRQHAIKTAVDHFMARHPQEFSAYLRNEWRDVVRPNINELFFINSRRRLRF